MKEILKKIIIKTADIKATMINNHKCPANIPQATPVLWAYVK